MVDILKPTDTFEKAELSNGDIVIFHKTLSETEASAAQMKFPRAPEYFRYMVNRTTVRFRELAAPREDKHVLQLAKDNSYDEVVTALGNILNIDPFKIRLTQHSSMYNSPRSYPIKHSERQNLLQMLSYLQPRACSDILYYELLDRPIQELENNKLLKISWFTPKVIHQGTHQVLVPKTARFSDVIAKLKEQLPEEPGDIRIMEVHYNKINRNLSPDEPVSGHTEYSSLRAELIAEDEQVKGANRIQVVHFYHDPPMTHFFGDPFYFVIHKGEKLGEVKKRIQQKLDITDEEFAKWKFALVHAYLGKSRSLVDDDTILSNFMSSEFLGIEHAPKRGRMNRRAPEIGIVIKN